MPGDSHKVKPEIISGTSDINAVVKPGVHATVVPQYHGILSALLESRAFSTIVSVSTVYALFGDDIRLIAFPGSLDTMFYSISTICLVLFSAELIGNCVVKGGYVMSFYFWLDLAATVSLVPDIGWIWNSFIDASSGDDGQSTALKAGRASRAGTKAGRIVRIVRLVRMVRIVKLYKMSKGDEAEQLEPEVKNEPSKVGKKMSEMTTRRVIVIVLMLVLMIPMFDGGLDDSTNEYQKHGLRRLHYVGGKSVVGENDPLFINLLEDYVRNSGRLLHLQLNGVEKEISNDMIRNVRFQDASTGEFTLQQNPVNEWSAEKLISIEQVSSDFRATEVRLVAVTGCFNDLYIVDTGNCSSIAVFDISKASEWGATMNIVKTFFIMLVLGVSAVAFAKIAEVLVITPIERMMNLIKRLAENPLASTNQNGPQFASDKKAKDEGYETALLEATLVKIGALMQVGFGAAGADIIGKNMGSGELDPMLPGKKITAIYGFCDIRQFTDTTECLQEDVMVYVNKLGHIMHSGTHSYYGMANKNVGDAFLLSWKICDGELPGYSRFEDAPEENARKHANDNYKCPMNAGAGKKTRSVTPTEMADSALTAFLKCLIDLDNANTNGPLTCYLSNERVVKRFGNNFRIRMGFGMHVGWAIEGAIGSRFKIDATYISPHVEMSDRLEAGSKIFMTPMNLSHWFVALLSPAARSYLRIIDRIKISGVSQPVTIYTYDVVNMVKTFGQPTFDSTGMQIAVDFANNPQYALIQEGLHPEFKPAFEKAVQAYFSGDWEEAQKALQLVATLRPNDGPSQCLSSVLSASNYKSPPNWPGYRELEKY